MSEYELRYKDRLLAYLGCLGDLFYIAEVFVNSEVLFMLKSNDSLMQWIGKRQTLISRSNSIELFKTAGIKSLKDFVDITYCLSICDCLWIIPRGSNKRWSDYSLFQNSFNSVLTKVAMGKIGFHGTVIKTPSPELVIGGSSLKWCKKVNGKILLYKSFGGLAELEYSGCYAEYFASQLCEYLGVRHVHYDLVGVNDILCCVSECFSNEHVSQIPVCFLYDDAKYLDMHLSHYIGTQFEKDFRDLMIVDCLTFNVDRHDENIAMLYDDDLRLKCLSPAYDFDHSMFFDLSLESRSLEYVSEKMRTYRPITYHSHTFLDQFNMCIYPEMYSKLVKCYKEFEFANHAKYPISSERLNKINWLFKVSLKGYLNGRTVWN